MKLRILTISALTAGIIAASAVSAIAETSIKVFVDNSEVTFDQAPTLLDGRTMVPVRAVFEKAGATVDWNADTQTATLTKGNYTVTTKIGDPYLMKNGKPVAIDVPATIINERLSIPVRAIAEAMDFGVTWNSVRNSVLISTTGKEYRANAQWRTGFMTLEDGGFVVTSDLSDIPCFDLDGNGENDLLAFIPLKKSADGTTNTPALWINGASFNSVLSTDLEPYGVAVADIVGSDRYTEILVLYNSEDGRCAGVYRYNGSDVFQIKANNSADGMIYFQNKLFIDGAENIISDTDGLCFLDTMLCSGVYSLEDSDLIRYLWKTDSAVGRTFTRLYNDNQPLSYEEVTLYNKGSYVNNVTDNDIIYSDTLTSFEVLDCYVDEKDPSKFEYFIELPNGKTAVIWPYAG